MNNSFISANQHPVNLDSPDWRDANIATMDQWHPHFHRIKPHLDELLSQYEAIAGDYYALLCSESTDPNDELRAHISDEVNQWLLNRMDSTIYSLTQ